MKEIQLTQGQVALVDDSDYEWLNQWKWHTKRSHKTCYAWRGVRVSRTKTEKIWMHRLIMDTPAGMQVDHIDHVGTNNQRANLRNCTQQQNHMNCAPIQGAKYVGIKYDSLNHRWCAAIKAEGVLRNMGSYLTAEAAAEAHDLAAVYYFKEFAHLNFPDRRDEYIDRAEDLILNRKRITSSKYIGVSWYKAGSQWEAYVSRDKKRRRVGVFADEVEAAIARDKMAVELYGDAAKLNFPDKINDYLCLINDTKKVLV